MSRYKNLYDALVENGELKAVYPRMTGDWTKDEKKFISEQQLLEQYAGAIDMDNDDEV